MQLSSKDRSAAKKATPTWRGAQSCNSRSTCDEFSCRTWSGHVRTAARFLRCSRLLVRPRCSSASVACSARSASTRPTAMSALRDDVARSRSSCIDARRCRPEPADRGSRSSCRPPDRDAGRADRAASIRESSGSCRRDGPAAGAAAARAPRELRRAERLPTTSARPTTAPPAISATATSSPSSTASSRSRTRTARRRRGRSPPSRSCYQRTGRAARS